MLTLSDNTKIHKEASEIVRVLGVKINLQERARRYRSYLSAKIERPVMDFEELLSLLERKKLLLASSSSNSISEYWDELEEVVDVCKVLDRYRDCFSFDTPSSYAGRVNLTLSEDIFEVFETGRNIVVLGEAGSGKTTNLQVYAKKLLALDSDILVVPSTLHDLGLLSDLSTSDLGVRLVDAISKLLQRLSINITPIMIVDRFKKGKAKLVLDSIDEAVGNHPWIIDALTELSLRFPDVQIITSSRFSIKGVEAIEFSHVILKPFSDEQKDSFFDSWFSGFPERSGQIKAHLQEYPEIGLVVSNPLSATILCVLCENEISLPRSEANLYKSRFDLLSGVFDRYKGIQRLSNTPESIIRFSRQLAYLVHFDKKRNFSVDFILNKSEREVVGFESSEYKGLIADLIKSEILVSDMDGGYDFGHLKFQEYLVSLDLVHRRSVKIEKLILNDWWRGVFVLYAQHAEEIEWLVNRVQSAGVTSKASDLLGEMIAFRYEKERRVLFGRVNSVLFTERECEWEASEEEGDLLLEDDYF